MPTSNRRTIDGSSSSSVGARAIFRGAPSGGRLSIVIPKDNQEQRRSDTDARVRYIKRRELKAIETNEVANCTGEKSATGLIESGKDIVIYVAERSGRHESEGKLDQTPMLRQREVEPHQTDEDQSANHHPPDGGNILETTPHHPGVQGEAEFENALPDLNGAVRRNGREGLFFRPKISARSPSAVMKKMKWPRRSRPAFVMLSNRPFDPRADHRREMTDGR
jgi:hypothetical protein